MAGGTRQRSIEERREAAVSPPSQLPRLKPFRGRRRRLDGELSGWDAGTIGRYSYGSIGPA